MRIAIFHNRYRERGGEDTAVDGEAELLEKGGHTVVRCIADNREALSRRRSARCAPRCARAATPRARRASRSSRASAPLDVAHVHNFFPVLSPALHEALTARGMPVVQTLHNYRLRLREREPAARGPRVRGVRAARPVERGALRLLPRLARADARVGGRRSPTTARATPGAAASTASSRRPRSRRASSLAAGAAAASGSRCCRTCSRIRASPRRRAAAPCSSAGSRAEKGVDLLIDAWREQGGAPLSIVGSGPAEAALRERARGVPGVRFLGALPHDAALRALREAAFAVVPSRWYEISPFAAIEALACARPVVAWRGGALAELVGDGRSGLLFDALEPGERRARVRAAARRRRARAPARGGRARGLSRAPRARGRARRARAALRRGQRRAAAWRIARRRPFASVAGPKRFAVSRARAPITARAGSAERGGERARGTRPRRSDRRASPFSPGTIRSSAQPGEPRAEHRQPAGHRLVHDQTPGIAEAREDQQIRCGIDAGQRVGAQRRQPRDRPVTARAASASTAPASGPSPTNSNVQPSRAASGSARHASSSGAIPLTASSRPATSAIRSRVAERGAQREALGAASSAAEPRSHHSARRARSVRRTAARPAPRARAAPRAPGRPSPRPRRRARAAHGAARAAPARPPRRSSRA